MVTMRTVGAKQAARIYDVLGRAYGLAERFEGRAKHRSLELLDVDAGLRVLEVGPGTGSTLRTLVEGVGPAGLAVGIDISPVMARLAKQRSEAPVVVGDARAMPFADQAFDRVFCSYVLDLIAPTELSRVLSECFRILRRGGIMVNVSLTEGTTGPSRAFVGTWKALYRVSPTLCAGCRPIRLRDEVRAVGFDPVHVETVVEWAVPSEIVAARRPQP